jgi:hypothetical protein
MKKTAFRAIFAAFAVLGAAAPAGVFAQAAAPQAPAAAEKPKEAVCFESRKGASEITQREIKPGLLNVTCSPETGAALWYGDPYEGTVPMGKMPMLEDIPEGKAVVRPRAEKLNLLAACGTACHNGTVPPGFPKDNKPVPIPTMEGMLPEIKDMQHGRGRIWCLECHHSTQRNMLVDHFGEPVSFDQPQLLCGKCHGDKLRDWRDGIHGKRIGEFVSGGKKRWFVCTECHSPHDVQNGERNRGFAQLKPESPPQLPHGMKNANYEKSPPVPH